jgi:tRNA-2-methylthio-N6-dimethylallyladenosine synthase
MSKHVYIETYGCQMNVADSEIVGGVLSREGYSFTTEIGNADVILVNTCSIRDNAEQRIYGRLGSLRSLKRANPGLVVGILGCMGERLRSRLVEEERLVDIVVGPDEYRKLPTLIETAPSGEKGIAVKLSRVENYEDIVPLRTDGVCAWISVVRGCDKFCSFCVVPFTRGRERSRSLRGIVDEVTMLRDQGYREIALLGQNVNSYHDGDNDFADLMESVARVDRSVRVRFTTSHPRDMSAKLIETIATNGNICKHIHLPVQSGANRILGLMNRGYTVEHYLGLVERIRSAIPGVSLTTDIISGFPTETVAEHRLTMEFMQHVLYDGAYTFKYSRREHTKAWEREDDVTEQEKGERVFEITEMQQQISRDLNDKMIDTIVTILVEGPSKKSPSDHTGRTDTNKMVVFPKSDDLPGQYVDVMIHRVNSATLFGTRVSTSAGENPLPALKEVER